MKQEELSNKLLSDITVFSKYSKYIPELGRRETWKELVSRNKGMHLKKFPELTSEIDNTYKYVESKQVLPSMRSLQFGGKPIELANNRIFNCAYLPFEDISCFSELMFLLLGGTGAGYSVQSHHINQLPVVQKPSPETRRFLVGDSIEGWADCIKVLMESYFLGKAKVRFDFSDIREKGAELVTSGGKAPGPEPLKLCVKELSKRLDSIVGNKVTPLQAHDLGCTIADAVLAGGIRRAALICLFDYDDQDMLSCKSGEWYIDNPQRGRANNSAVLLRDEVTYDKFMSLMKQVRDSNAGEPAVYFTNNKGWGTNPCCEIALRPYQMCNLTEVNVSDVTSQEDLNNRVRAGAFLGTLQASYTDFHYLNPKWKQTCEEDALIGVGMTGIGSASVLSLDLVESASEVVKENIRVAKMIGINQSKRTTTVKPAGSSSLVVGSSSGIHAWHAKYYLRRMRVGKNEALYQYLVDKVPELVEDDQFVPNGAVIKFPQKAPEGSILRTETMTLLLERVRRFNLDWVRTGHISGDNTHNVSCTVSVKDDGWDEISQWMWNNRNDYNGIAVLPYDGGSYVQAPFEDITEEEFTELLPYLTDIDLTEVLEETNETNLSGELACSGGACDISM